MPTTDPRWKIYIFKKNSPWGVIKHPQRGNVYKHVVWTHNDKKNEFIDKELMPTGTKFADAVFKYVSFSPINELSFTFRVSYKDYQATYDELNNSDFCAVKKPNDTRIYFYTLQVQRADIGQVEFMAEMDVFFTYLDNNLLSNTRESFVSQGHEKRYLADGTPDWDKVLANKQEIVSPNKIKLIKNLNDKEYFKWLVLFLDLKALETFKDFVNRNTTIKYDIDARVLQTIKTINGSYNLPFVIIMVPIQELKDINGNYQPIEIINLYRGGTPEKFILENNFINYLINEQGQYILQLYITSASSLGKIDIDYERFIGGNITLTFTARDRENINDGVGFHRLQFLQDISRDLSFKTWITKDNVSIKGFTYSPKANFSSALYDTSQAGVGLTIAAIGIGGALPGATVLAGGGGTAAVAPLKEYKHIAKNSSGNFQVFTKSLSAVNTGAYTYAINKTYELWLEGQNTKKEIISKNLNDCFFYIKDISKLDPILKNSFQIQLLKNSKNSDGSVNWKTIDPIFFAPQYFQITLKQWNKMGYNYSYPRLQKDKDTINIYQLFSYDILKNSQLLWIENDKRYKESIPEGDYLIIENTESFTISQNQLNAYMRDNKNAYNVSYETAKMNADFSITNAKVRRNLGIAGAVVGGIGAAASGNVGTLGSVALGGVATAITGKYAIDQAEKRRAMVDKQFKATISDLENRLPTLTMNNSDNINVFLNNHTPNEHKIKIIEKGLDDNSTQILQGHINKFGYEVNKFQNIKTFINTRKRYNYIECDDVFNDILPNLSPRIKQTINDAFANGLYIWHYRSATQWKGIKNFTDNNDEV